MALALALPLATLVGCEVQHHCKLASETTVVSYDRDEEIVLDAGTAIVVVGEDEDGNEDWIEITWGPEGTLRRGWMTREEFERSCGGREEQGNV